MTWLRVGLYDWDLSSTTKTDGTFSLEDLNYDFPQEFEGGSGKSGGTACQNTLGEINQEAACGIANSRVDVEGESSGDGVRVGSWGLLHKHLSAVVNQNVKCIFFQLQGKQGDEGKSKDEP